MANIGRYNEDVEAMEASLQKFRASIGELKR
jgi:hypothetical protein